MTNENVIKAAPDMLKALQYCLDAMTTAYPNGLPVQQGTLCEEQNWNTSVRLARAAIAKATIK
jgi:hypothetical protein